MGLPCSKHLGVNSEGEAKSLALGISSVRQTDGKQADRATGCQRY